MSNLDEIRIKTVPITLADGKSRTLKFDLNAFAELEELYGSVDAAMKQLQKGSLKGVRGILWAGLIHEECILDKEGSPTGKYKISPYQVGALIGFGNLENLSKKLMEAMSDNLPRETAGGPESNASPNV